MNTKTCTRCKTEKTFEEFGIARRNPNGMHFWCKMCCAVYNREYNAKNKERVAARIRSRRAATPGLNARRARDYRAKPNGRARLMVNDAMNRAKKVGIPFDLSKHIKALEVRMFAGVCEVSGLPFNLSQGARTWASPSLDRINPAKGYVIENVRIVCWAVNAAMGNWGEDQTEVIMRAWLKRIDDRRLRVAS